MKVLHVLNHSVPYTDGYCIRSANIVRFQKQAGIEPIVLTSNRQEPIPSSLVESIDGVTYHRATLESPKQRFLSELRTIHEFKSRIVEIASLEKVDVIHAHSPCSWGYAALKAARASRIPFVYEVRGLWEDSAVDRGRLRSNGLKYTARRKLETYVARRADALAVISNSLVKEFESRGTPRDRIFVVPNAVDLAKFTSSNQPNETSDQKRSSETTIGYIGSLYCWEGVDDFIRAAAQIIERQPNTKFVIVGSGEEENSLRALVDHLQLGESIRLTGRVPHSAIADFYRDIDILVYPRKRSRTTELITPLKPLEAMIMRKPIIVSDVGGLTELVPSEMCVSFRAGDVSDLVDKTVQLICDQPRRDSLGLQSQQYVINERDWSKVVTRYHPIYDFAVNGSRAAGRGMQADQQSMRQVQSS